MVALFLYGDRSFGSNIRNDQDAGALPMNRDWKESLAACVLRENWFSAVIFAVSYYFAMNKSSVIDKIGNYLTPLLLVSLVAVIILAIVHPIDRLGKGRSQAEQRHLSMHF